VGTESGKEDGKRRQDGTVSREGEKRSWEGKIGRGKMEERGNGWWEGK
jgi:hypothetical protein